MTAPRKSNRRAFLQGRAAVDALQDATLGAESLAAGSSVQPSALPANYLVQWTRRAMACEFTIYLNAGQYDGDGEATLAALDLIEALEDQMTVYREHSEISRLNRTAAQEAVVVESRLFALLELGVQIFRDTGGAYDLTSGPLSRVWGFTRRVGNIPSNAALAEALACVGSQHLELQEVDQSVRYLRAGLEINLGSIGKGYALDRAAETLRGAGIGDVLLHGGHSSVLGLGSEGSRLTAGESTNSQPNGNQPKAGWSIGVRHPLRPEHRLGEICLHNRALSTSGSGTQFFLHQGHRYGHILDPRTGWPAEYVLSATVLANSAAMADALSTAFYVMGPEQAAKYCRQHSGVSALLITAAARGRHQSTTEVQIHNLGLSPDEWFPAA